MVDVSNKSISLRQAVAEGTISMQAKTFDHISEGKHKKGDVLAVARIAGIMAAKQTATMIPLCHPIPITTIAIDFSPQLDNQSVTCRATVKTNSQTGVEMEALLAVQISLLTIYDMCKAIDRGMCMFDIQLISKSGGKSGDWHRT